MRDVINKGLTEEVILTRCEWRRFQVGWSKRKAVLYDGTAYRDREEDM